MIIDTTGLGPAGVVLRPELIARGFTDSEIQRGVREGTIIRLDRGCYLAPVGIEPPRPIDRYRARVVARSGRSVATTVSHLSALAVHRLPIDGADVSRVHVTRDGPSGGLWEAGYVRHAGVLKVADRTEVDGVRVTTVARTLVDVGRTESLRTAVVAADAALKRAVVTPAEVRAALIGAARRQGVAAARRALHFADGRAESVGESRLRIQINDLGFSPPELQVESFDRRGAALGRSDAGYEDLGVLIEFDGLEKYLRPFRHGDRSSEVVVREKLREDRMRAAGFVVVRFIWADLDRPQLIRHRLGEALQLGHGQVAAGAITGSLRPRPPVRVDPR